MFSEVPLACLGSMAAAVQCVELSENMLQNLFHNLPPQTVISRLSSESDRGAPVHFGQFHFRDGGPRSKERCFRVQFESRV